MPYKAGALYPCNPATARSESTKLAVDPKGEKLIYTNGRAVIIRDINNPAIAHAYTQHTQTTTVARISPSGYYCASADVAGNVRIWDVTQSENVLKLAIRPLAGKINDLAWDGESKRLIVGGEGKDKFGAAFFIDSGSSCGEIAGHAKAITSLSVRHQRPFRAISGSDDNSVVFHTAVPFKYDKILSSHTRFVRDVGYAPNGELFASVASDGKLFFYEGKTGELKGEADRGGASSSLMACSWAPDSSKIASAGADGVVSIWDASSLKASQTYTVGSDVPSQQNGVVYAGANTVISISLSGTLNVFDTRESSSTKWRAIHGPTKAITASALSEGKDKTFYAGSFDGTMKSFSVGGEAQGTCADVEGTGHSARVSAISGDGQGNVWSAGWDDKVSSIEGSSFASKSVSTKGQPASIAATSTALYVATPSGLEIHPHDGSSTTHAGSTSAVAAHPSPNGDVVAFGSGAKKVVIASVSGTSVKVESEIEDNKGEVLALAFSPDGTLLASGDAMGRIILVDVKEKKTLVSSRWTFHTGRITALAFSPDGKRLASAGIDESIYVWEVDRPLKNTAIKNAHPGGVSGVAWIEGSTGLISAGADGCARTWTVDQV
ncbi:WD40-repeat-containing domain protein [Naematelia encephala]|uniref:WD40-repeat-containing domain protein n=1 Tax=Naematelia encephala TaxID=71784 RepID=A0A1Y2AJU8_9TREE|nr:WD40-repeat-containing domain protein [Naematelia encephala]